jgi:hypothetical protein
MAERPDIWMIAQDGMPLLRGLTRQRAESQASALKAGLDQHRAGSRIRSVDITIQRDQDAMQTREALYREFKGYRNGGNLTKTHTQWAVTKEKEQEYGTGR